MCLFVGVWVDGACNLRPPTNKQQRTPSGRLGARPRGHNTSSMPTVTLEEPSGAIEDGKSMDEKHGDLLFEQVCRGGSANTSAHARERSLAC